MEASSKGPMLRTPDQSCPTMEHSWALWAKVTERTSGMLSRLHEQLFLGRKCLSLMTRIDLDVCMLFLLTPFHLGLCLVLVTSPITLIIILLFCNSEILFWHEV